jgi:hypothetical protein
MPLRGVAGCYRTGSGSDRIQALHSVVRVVVGEDLFSSRPLRSLASRYRTGSGSDRIQAFHSVVRVFWLAKLSIAG